MASSGTIHISTTKSLNVYESICSDPLVTERKLAKSEVLDSLKLSQALCVTIRGFQRRASDYCKWITVEVKLSDDFLSEDDSRFINDIMAILSFYDKPESGHAVFLKLDRVLFPILNQYLHFLQNEFLDEHEVRELPLEIAVPMNEATIFIADEETKEDDASDFFIADDDSRHCVIANRHVVKIPFVCNRLSGADLAKCCYKPFGLAKEAPGEKAVAAADDQAQFAWPSVPALLPRVSTLRASVSAPISHALVHTEISPDAFVAVSASSLNSVHSRPFYKNGTFWAVVALGGVIGALIGFYLAEVFGLFFCGLGGGVSFGVVGGLFISGSGCFPHKSTGSSSRVICSSMGIQPLSQSFSGERQEEREIHCDSHLPDSLSPHSHPHHQQKKVNDSYFRPR